MSRRLLRVLLPATLFVIILGLKLDVIDRFGSDLPHWDQWDAEGLHVYMPWFNHRLGLTDFFRPHNEHRIVLTKLLGFAELLLNGQWDVRLQCVVNALLHSSLAALFFCIGRRHLAREWQVGWFALVALLCGLPLAWQNVLGGFHSQQYFLIGLTFGAIYLLPFASPWSRRWWAGAACAFLALFSMGSGLFAAAIVLPVALLRGWLLRQRQLIPPPTLALCLGIIALAWVSRVEVYFHESLKAHTLGDFLLYAVHSLQWPAQNHPWLALILWAPVIGLLGVVLRRGVVAAEINFPLFTLGLGGWTVLQILASAYARGAGAGWPASRYVDTLTLGTLANALALGWHTNRTSQSLRYFCHAFAVAWLGALSFGLYPQIRLIYTEELPSVHRSLVACERNVRHYLATGDISCLQEPDIPYPSTSAFRERIDLLALQAIMPVSVRRPLRLDSSHSGPFHLLDTRPHQPNLGEKKLAAQNTKTEILGLSPDTTLLDYTRTWGSYGSNVIGEWIGRPLNLAQRSYLRFQIAGDISGPSTSLIVRNPTLGFVRAQFGSPTGNSPGAWRTIYVPVPSGQLDLLARQQDATSWFAFSEPVEMPPLSYWAAKAARWGSSLWPAAATLAVLLWSFQWLLNRRE